MLNTRIPHFRVQAELVRLLYQQISFGLWAESFAALCLAAGLAGAMNQTLILGWLLLNLLVCGIGRHLLVFFYRRTTHGGKLSAAQIHLWLSLFILGTFLSGISWGVTGSLLMVKNDLVRQAFQIFLLVGVTAAANPLYSPSRSAYAFFLIPAFTPFAIWLMLQGGIYISLGALAFVYIGLMLATSFFAHKLIISSLSLRFEKIDLVDDLSLAKTALEGRTEELERSLSLVKATLESTTDGILVVDSKNHIEDFNKKLIEMWDIKSFSTLLGKPLTSIINLFLDQLENPDSLLEKLAVLHLHPEEETFDELLFKNGCIFECYSHPQRIGNRVAGRVWSFRDVTGRKSLEAKLYQRANYDVLTDLPNRVLLLDRITHAINAAKESRQIPAILFLDVDRFKLINDTLGHTFGDKLLKAVSSRLKTCVQETDTVSREGGDEFIIILNALANEADTIEIVSRILKAIREPFIIEGHKFNITISIGISFYPKDGEDPEKLIRNADIAMYHAKELGRNNFQFFTEEMNKKVLQRLVMENQLREALEQKEFFLMYQPIVNIKTGYIVGLEALLRWKHPRLVSIPTPDFIRLAEETGVIVEIGDWVIRQACILIKQCQLKGFANLQVAVNLSSRQFKRSTFIEQVQHILSEINLDPHSLVIELTESVIMDDADKSIDALHQMKEMGITVVIDDFGTGYSSLNYLKRLPVDKLKIDRSFIKDLPTHADDVAITTAIIALAGKLNLKVIAEGVEKVNQLNFLIEHHCDEMQGYLFSEALNDKDILKLLEENRTHPYTAVTL